MTDLKADSPISGRHLSWSFWLGTLVSVACMVWAVVALDWDAVIDALTQANLLWVSIAVLTVLLTILVRLARWMVLLHPRTMGSQNLLAAMLVGQLLNYFAPARAGDFARAYVLGDVEGESKAWALGTVALEKLWDIWALLILVVLLGFSISLPNWLTVPARGLVVLALSALVLSWLFIKYRSRATAVVAWGACYLPSKIAVPLNNSVESLLDGFGGLRQPRVWVWTAVWSAVAWGIGALTNHTVFLALGLSLPFSAALMLLAVLQMGIAVPSLPGRVGIFEGLCIVVLALYGVSRDAAFAVGLVLHVVVFVPPILLGLFYAWRLNRANP